MGADKETTENVVEAEYTIEDDEPEFSIEDNPEAAEEQPGLDLELRETAVLAHGVRAPLVQAEGIIAARGLLEELISKAMVPGKHYGVIPNTSKPSLYKAGAELAVQWFGYTISFPQDRVTKIENVAESFFMYSYFCVLTDRNGNPVAEAEGSCNTREGQYHKPTQKKNAKLTAFDYINTVQKMAQKRAFVGAVLFGCGLSDHFTQDIEDNPEAFGKSESPFSLDDEIGFGKHSDKTWKEMCEADAKGDDDYITWVIDNLDKLRPEQKKVLSDYISSLKGGSEPTSILNQKMTGGKHKGKTWAQLIAQDPDYVDWATGEHGLKKLSQGDKKHLREHLENADQDKHEDPQTHMERYSVLCLDDPTVTPEGAKAFARVHPRLPDMERDWKEEHFKIAVQTFPRYGGPGKSFQAALDVEAKAAPAPELDGEPTKVLKRETLDAIGTVGNRAVNMGIASDDELKALQAMADQNDAEGVEEVLGVWKQAILEAVSRGIKSG